MIPSDSLIPVHPANNVSYSGHCTAAGQDKDYTYIALSKYAKQQHLCVQKSSVLSAVYKYASDRSGLCIQQGTVLFRPASSYKCATYPT